MKSFLFTAAIFLLIAQRKCMNRANPVPSCVQQKIDSLKKEPPFNPRAEVHEYVYNNKRVFYFSADCCDFFTTLADENCNYICAPGGGIKGSGDGKCSDFAQAKHVARIWVDER